ncbi:hypothetical protein TSAR_007559 [Trichomalopsis sarcophagae]|uniref:Endonuclease/exonuclease/phosphatase domain-containing protein n=1 Tax=Trichomalopsis sarcophagae TaxID=543379 RepID=A0A232FDG7_9HYME|nr:hypothetical protein TSAR_007559 [Trichomalopsis sarcophagae]
MFLICKILFVQKVTFCVSETWLPDEEDVHLPNFNCIAKFKRKIVRAAGVATYQNQNNLHIATLNIDLTVQNAAEIVVAQAAIGDLCASQITMNDGRQIIIVVVHISPNQKINDIITFLHKRLFPYCSEGSMIFNDNSHQLPMILAGDFNINIANNDSIPLITFLDEVFELRTNNVPRQQDNILVIIGQLSL